MSNTVREVDYVHFCSNCDKPQEKGVIGYEETCSCHIQNSQLEFRHNVKVHDFYTDHIKAKAQTGGNKTNTRKLYQRFRHSQRRSKEEALCQEMVKEYNAGEEVIDNGKPFPVEKKTIEWDLI